MLVASQIFMLTLHSDQMTQCLQKFSDIYKFYIMNAKVWLDKVRGIGNILAVDSSSMSERMTELGLENAL